MRPSNSRLDPLGPAYVVLLVLGAKQGRGVDTGRVAKIIASAELAPHLGFSFALWDLGALPHRQVRTSGQQQAAPQPVTIFVEAPEADHLIIVGGFESRPSCGAESQELVPMLRRCVKRTKGVVALAARRFRSLWA